jgi:hypothetical protein
MSRSRALQEAFALERLEMVADRASRGPPELLAQLPIGGYRLASLHAITDCSEDLSLGRGEAVVHHLVIPLI